MKTKIKKKIQKLTLTSVFDIITQTYKQTPATLVGLAAEPVDQVISRIPANSTVTRSVQLTIGAQTKSGDHTIMATAQTASTDCGGARKSVKTVLTVKEQKKTVLLERKDGIQEHYHVCDNDPKYASEFGIPTETTWA